MHAVEDDVMETDLEISVVSKSSKSSKSSQRSSEARLKVARLSTSRRSSKVSSTYDKAMKVVSLGSL